MKNRARASSAVPQQLLDRNPGALERRGTGLETGQIEQGVKDPQEPVGIVPGRLQHLLLGG